MFTLQQVKAAHSKVKTGADFPRYVQEIKNIGLIRYEYMVKNGVTIYYGKEERISADAIYAPLAINKAGSPEKLKHTIVIHQQGQTDFLTFCKQAADAGVQKWTVDPYKMMCTYYDGEGNILVEEPIPQGDYGQS